MYTLTQVTGGRGKSKTGDDSSFIELGPVGSKDGHKWDEKDCNRIVQIFISHEDDNIRSIQFQYVENGTLVMSDRHGDNDNGGCKFDVVELNYPAEYITWISGHRTGGSYNNCDLSSITFGTNIGKYGPFGQFMEDDREFCFRLGKDNRQFGGFHGTANEYKVKSIGVYLKPITTLDYSSNENLGE
ncbi:hypothetical protein OROHE_003272 [Orobanche hederae]